MTPQDIFSLAGTVIGPLWLLQAASLFWRPLRQGVQLTAYFGLPVALGGVYIFAMAPHVPSESGGFGSLAEVRTLFANDWILLAGWVHYLAFDFFVGAWIVADAVENRISRILTIPCLAGCFLAGPAGLFAYLVLRGASAALKRGGAQ